MNKRITHEDINGYYILIDDPTDITIRPVMDNNLYEQDIILTPIQNKLYASFIDKLARYENDNFKT